MQAPKRAEPAVVAGFAVGVGLVFVATFGVYWHFWRAGTSPWLWAGVSFLVGAALGAIWAWWRKVRL